MLLLLAAPRSTPLPATLRISQAQGTKLEMCGAKIAVSAFAAREIRERNCVPQRQTPLVQRSVHERHTFKWARPYVSGKAAIAPRRRLYASAGYYGPRELP